MFGKKTGIVEFYADAVGKIRFRIKANNGETVASGEGYVTTAAAENGIKAIKRALKNPLIKKI